MSSYLSVPISRTSPLFRLPSHPTTRMGRKSSNCITFRPHLLSHSFSSREICDRSLSLGRVPEYDDDKSPDLHHQLHLHCLEEVILFVPKDSPLFGIVVLSATATLRRLRVHWSHSSVLNALVVTKSRNVVTYLQIDGYQNPNISLQTTRDDNSIMAATRAFIQACSRLRHLSLIALWTQAPLMLEALVSPLLSLYFDSMEMPEGEFTSHLAGCLIGPHALSTLRLLRVLGVAPELQDDPTLNEACKRGRARLKGAQLGSFWKQGVDRP